MSDGPPEKRQGFERWVASLKIGSPLRPPSNPPPAAEGADGSPLTLDEQATLINRLPKELIHKLRERDSQRAGLPKSDDSTAVFTPPPELLARAKRFQPPTKPERSSPQSSPSPIPRPNELPTTRPPPPIASAAQANLSAAEAAAFRSLESSEEEATTFYRPDSSRDPSSGVPSSRDPAPGAPSPGGTLPGFPSSVPPAVLQGDLSRPGDIQWIDGLASSPPSRPAEPLRRGEVPEGGPTQPVVGSMAPAERRLRWVAVLVAMVLLAGIFLLSRMQ